MNIDYICDIKSVIAKTSGYSTCRRFKGDSRAKLVIRLIYLSSFLLGIVYSFMKDLLSAVFFFSVIVLGAPR